MMNIYKYEVKKVWLSSLIWIVAISFFVWMCLAMFEMIADPSWNKVLESFPDAFKKAFGMDRDMSTILGFFSMIFSFVFLSGAIFSCNLGLNALSVEERDRTADFLIPKPVTRTKIVTEKLLAAGTHIVLFNIVIGLVSWVSIESYKAGQEYSFTVFILILLGLLIFQLLFFSIGIFISVCLKRMNSPLPFSLGISFGFYILNAFDLILKDTFIKYLIPYDYFEVGYIIDNQSFKIYGLVISIVLIVGFIASSYILYKKRNIATAM